MTYAIEPLTLTKLAAYEQEAREVTDALRDYPCSTDEQKTMIVDTGKEAKRRAAEVEDMRKPIARSIDESKAAVQALFTPPRDAWLAIEKLCKDKLAAARMSEIEAARKAEIEAAQVAAELRKLDAAATTVAAVEEKRTELALAVQASTVSKAPTGTGARAKWTARVTDIVALAAAVGNGTAPSNLVRGDDSALRMLAAATKGTAKIPGVVFEEDVQISFRGAR